MENQEHFGRLTDRMAAFREEVLEEKPYIDAERAVLATQAYKENQNQPRVMVRALMLQKILENMSIYIEDKSLIAGNQATKNKNAPIFPEKYLNTKKELKAMLVGYLGGRAAEEIVFDTVTTGAANDIEQATKVARAMITQYGMSEKFGLMGLATQETQYLSGRAVLNCGDDTATEIDHEVMKLLHHSYEEAKRILGSHRTEMDKIAEYLIRKETITGKEFMKILRAVQQGLDIPENLDDLVLSEDEKEVSNKQDIEMIAENNEAAKSTESVQFRPEISGQELTEDMQAPEKTEESAQTTDADHTETEEKPGSQA